MLVMLLFLPQTHLIAGGFLLLVLPLFSVNVDAEDEEGGGEVRLELRSAEVVADVVDIDVIDDDEVVS